jgi:hypothetical protein
MQPEQWKRIEELFQGALEREGVERAVWLAMACAAALFWSGRGRAGQINELRVGRLIVALLHFHSVEADVPGDDLAQTVGIDS